MKKKILLFLLLFIPFMINAEEKCTIVSGNGQDIGSEIACGTEHFYIIEDKEDSVRMLAKYNLGIGYEYNRIIISAERYAEFETICAGVGTKCTALLNEPEFEEYDGFSRVDLNDDGSYSYIVNRKIKYSEVKQSSKAIGAHGDEKGNPEFPEYGIIEYAYIDEYSGFDGELYGNGNFQDHLISSIDLYVPDKHILTLFDNYKNVLQDGSIAVNDISILSVKEINDIVFRITNDELPLDEWGMISNWIEAVTPSGYKYYIVGSIKDNLPDEYNWLYSTTYWTRTYKYQTEFDETNYYFDESDLFFIDTLGNLCNDSACSAALGAGIRPVVEISKDSINYNLTTKSDNGGTLETDKSHVVGDTIVLNAKPKTGYKLEKLIVTTDSGTTIEVSGKDIVENEDGTISINPEVFTMPLENVVVEAKWAFVNPKTGVSSFIGIIFTLLLIGISGFFMIKNYNNSYEL